MEGLTVISGSGERFELALHGKEEIRRLAEIMEKFTGLAPEERRKQIIVTVNPFFPQHYQRSLQNLSAADAAKLASAFAQCCGGPGQTPPPSEEGDEAGKCENPFETEERIFSDTVIAAAFHYKWHLEYAAALPEELLKRCLRIAGAVPGKEAPSPPVEVHLTPEEIARAAARSAKALEKLSLAQHS